MMNGTKSTYVCRRLRLASYLKERGFLPYRTQPDYKNPRFNVFLYNKTDALLEAVEDYYHSDEFLNRN